MEREDIVELLIDLGYHASIEGMITNELAGGVCTSEELAYLNMSQIISGIVATLLGNTIEPLEMDGVSDYNIARLYKLMDLSSSGNLSPELEEIVRRSRG